jgi:hypothetical protein
MQVQAVRSGFRAQIGFSGSTALPRSGKLPPAPRGVHDDGKKRFREAARQSCPIIVVA